MKYCFVIRCMLLMSAFCVSLHGMQENQSSMTPLEYSSASPLEQAVADICPARVKTLLNAKADVSLQTLCLGWMTLYTACHDAHHTGNDPREFVKQAQECSGYLEAAYPDRPQLSALRPQVYAIWLQHKQQEEEEYTRTKREVRKVRSRLKRSLKHTRKKAVRCCAIL